MDIVYLIDAQTVRDNSVIQTNVDDKYINIAIQQSQNLELKSVYGDDLWNGVISQVKSSTTTADIQTLLDESQNFLVNYSVFYVLDHLFIKQTEAGLVHKTPEGTVNIDLETYKTQKKQQRDICETYKAHLQRFLKKNESKYDLFADSTYDKDANTNETYFCGIQFDEGSSCVFKGLPNSTIDLS